MADRYWRDDAACIGVDTDLFYPDRADPAYALAICQDCPVRTACLTEALAAGDQFGIWGGLGVNERRALRRRQRRSKSPVTLRGQRR